jgi:hypothetical protein
MSLTIKNGLLKMGPTVYTVYLPGKWQPIDLLKMGPTVYLPGKWQ